MLDRLLFTDSSEAATGSDVNIPRFARSETRTISAWAVTLQASVFLALLALPIVLINGMWVTPASAALVYSLTWAVRHSCFRYQRIRLS